MPIGPVYERTRTEGDPAEGSHYASGVSNGEHMVKLHFNRNPVTGVCTRQILNLSGAVV